MSLSDLRRAWNTFFFEPVSPLNIGVYRILLGLLLLNYGAWLAPDLLTWFSPVGALPHETARTISGGNGWVNLFIVFNDSPAIVWGLWTVFMVAAAFMTAGFLTRPSTCVAFILLATFHHRNALIVNSADAFLRLATFFMMFSHAGAALSIDRLLRIARGKENSALQPVEPWAMRMIQLQLCILYFAAFLWKSRGPLWADGTAMYYTARLPEFFRFPVPYVFEHMWTIRLGTWGTLAIEFALGTLVWVKELRYWVLAGGVLLHAGISYSMNIPQFSLVMTTAYVLWVAPEHLAGLVRWLSGAGPAHPTPVFYDGKCSFCVRSVEVLKALVLPGRIRWLDIHADNTLREFPDFDMERANVEMLLLTPKGTWLGGFHAWRHAARHLPLLWLLLPLTYLPGATAIGVRVYKWIAARRTCLIPVHAGAQTG